MDTIVETFTVTDLRHRTAEVLKTAEGSGFVYLFHRSRPKAAVVDLQYLRSLQEAYENYLDVLEFDRTVDLKRISLAEHKKRYGKRR